MPAKTYDPNDMIITFMGDVITGFADGTFISIVPSSERWGKTVGADGEVGRSKSNDNTYEVTITLMQTSASNDYLSEKLAADKNSNEGIGALQIIDKSGTTEFFFDSAWIRQPADSEYSKDVAERAWTFDTGQALQETIGGSNTTSA